MSDSEDGELKPTAVRRRSAARIAAVQILYQGQMSGMSTMRFLPEYMEHHAGDIARMLRVKKLEQTHLDNLVSTIESRREEFDGMLEGCLESAHRLERLGVINHAVLLAGTCELAAMPQHPARAVMGEYAGVAEVCGGDVGLVSAVLDRLAKTLRTEELGGSGGGVGGAGGGKPVGAASGKTDGSSGGKTGGAASGEIDDAGDGKIDDAAGGKTGVSQD